MSVMHPAIASPRALYSEVGFSTSTQNGEAGARLLPTKVAEASWPQTNVSETSPTGGASGRLLVVVVRILTCAERERRQHRLFLHLGVARRSVSADRAKRGPATTGVSGANPSRPPASYSRCDASERFARGEASGHHRLLLARRRSSRAST